MNKSYKNKLQKARTETLQHIEALNSEYQKERLQ